ncbi:UTRA domain-containing protein [Streptomyces sp. NPDC087440]|uniref:UTRA domain-containing protein n=1 Tax=Streptomyces sp. NPDC087440 TaxID=3365790 RepID=UPI0037F68828
MRAAPGVLQSEGLIEKQHGRGNFVRRPIQPITYTNDKVSADTRAAFAAALRVDVNTRQLRAEDRLMNLLQVERGALIREYVYLSFQGCAPHSLAHIYVPQAVAELDMPWRSSSPLGEDIRGHLAKAGIAVTSALDRATARLASATEERVLRLGRGTAVLVVERMSMDAVGRVVEAALLILPGHRADALFATHTPDPAVTE